MNDKKRPTIYDVAKLANTSATTVSRVFNNPGYPVREKLRKRIIQAAEELNYSPNLLAKSLKSNSSKDIGVIIPNISNPFYSAVISGIEEEANKNGFNILLCNTSRDSVKEREHMQSLYEKQVKGIILSPTNEGKENIIEYTQKGVEFVLMDQKVEAIDCSTINYNSRKGAFLAAEHLIKNGHKKIVFASSPLTRWTRKEIFKGYQEALKYYDIEFKDEYVLTADVEQEVEENGYGYEFKNGRAIAQELIDENLDVTAIMAVNDMTAFGVIQGLREYNKGIPDDFSIVGFDDIFFSNIYTPRLTTVHYPSYELGKLASIILFDKLKDPNALHLSINLEPKLVIRESVKDIS